MSYRYEKNSNGDQDLVISGWEDGIADSPYQGIANMRNLNTTWYPGITYSNYKRIRVNTSGGTTTFTANVTPSYLLLGTALTLNVGDAVNFTTTGSLPSPLSTAVTYFVTQLNTNGANTFQVSATLGGSNIALVNTGTGTHTVTLVKMGAPAYATQNNSNPDSPYGTVYVLDKNGRIWQNTGTVGGLPYFVLLKGNTLGGPNALGLAFYGNYLFLFRGTAIDVCGDGTGSVNSSLWTTDWMSSTAVTFNATPLKDSTSGTMTTSWGKPTGTYQITFLNETVTGQFTLGLDTVTWSPGLLQDETTAANVNLGNTGGLSRMAYVDQTSDILYFCNGRYIGSISTPAGRKFNKQLTLTGTSEINYAALILPIGVSTTWLEKQQLNLLIAAQDTIYQWDRVSLFTGIPVPVTENVVRMINSSNKVYVLAGLKGNIYTFNGYSVNILRKIPDYIASGAIDPQWSFGTPIAHRQFIYTPVWAKNSQAGTSVLNGIISVDDKGIINFQNQNSNGLTNASATADAVLFDVNTTEQDSYYSSWYDGTTGGIDYNNTTLYSSDEPVIETDLIPIGTFAQSKTYSNMEFKLDQPLQSGDTITIYARKSLSDSYVPVGTTTTSTTTGVTVSRLIQPLPFQKWQWVQFKITISCNPTATASSFVRLREIRIT